jgi:hypothetical protein
VSLRKGFLRIYTAVTACWALFWISVIATKGVELTGQLLFGVALPPVAAYVVLFIVVPWIGRGFKSQK